MKSLQRMGYFVGCFAGGVVAYFLNGLDFIFRNLYAIGLIYHETVSVPISAGFGQALNQTDSQNREMAFAITGYSLIGFVTVE